MAAAAIRRRRGCGSGSGCSAEMRNVMTVGRGNGHFAADRRRGRVDEVLLMLQLLMLRGRASNDDSSILRLNRRCRIYWNWIELIFISFLQRKK